MQMGNNYARVMISYCSKSYNPCRLVIFTTKYEKFVLYCNSREELNQFYEELNRDCIVRFEYNIKTKRISSRITIIRSGNNEHKIGKSDSFRKLESLFFKRHNILTVCQKNFNHYLESTYEN